MNSPFSGKSYLWLMRQASYLNLVTETDLRAYDERKDKLMQTKVLRVKQFRERGYYKTTNYRTTTLCVYIVIFVFHILFRDTYYVGRVSKKITRTRPYTW